ncbi:DUF1836 domain-containing protein [Lentibacillus amyloliquefaciens]|uniref:Cytoplasmic protein n=1 Tax=Lentibacillus amyloliquefaciens TaxID=1472767 RepID=A0A0U4E2M4_9BACI|nr:DUF1836 domain-containing protein [Lentibacillus amyloliquefaciens]ALX47137.1 hypothetical protein AOX59_00085 [Lentibacillus amyloliquefaciens]
MKSMDELAESLYLNSNLSLENIPDLNLYMDQVIQLFERQFADTKRNDDEKILTKTMINNYAKGKLFFPVENKKYTKDHLILISMIYQMKGALSINDVKSTLAKLNEKVTEDDTFELQDLYACYLQMVENSAEKFKADLLDHHHELTQALRKLEDQDEDYLEQLLLIATFTNMSNYYRRAAEKLVDEIGKDDKT